MARESNAPKPNSNEVLKTVSAALRDLSRSSSLLDLAEQAHNETIERVSKVTASPADGHVFLNHTILSNVQQAERFVADAEDGELGMLLESRPATWHNLAAESEVGSGHTALVHALGAWNFLGQLLAFDHDQMYLYDRHTVEESTLRAAIFNERDVGHVAIESLMQTMTIPQYLADQVPTDPHSA